MGTFKYVPMERETVEIDGTEYEIQINDAEVLERAMEILDEAKTPKALCAFVDVLVPGLPPSLGAFDRMVIARHITSLIIRVRDLANPTGEGNSGGTSETPDGSPAGSEEPSPTERFETQTSPTK